MPHLANASVLPDFSPLNPPSAKPIVKWVGGKSRLGPVLLSMLPPGAERMRHVEPFAGGAAMFFQRKPINALLSDTNPALIHTYQWVRDDVETVIRRLSRLAKRHNQQHYYEVRERYNNSNKLHPALRAAMFIYLNKTCFNGLHRVNRKGHFNVPAGSYVQPKIIDADALRRASQALQKVDLRQEHFSFLLKEAKPGDFVYLDPPYAPVSKTANFTSYTSGGFDEQMQQQLADVFAALDQRGCKLMLSNSDVPLIKKLYANYQIDTVVAPRMINSNAKRRGLVNELLVRNYS